MISNLCAKARDSRLTKLIPVTNGPPAVPLDETEEQLAQAIANSLEVTIILTLLRCMQSDGSLNNTRCNR